MQNLKTPQFDTHLCIVYEYIVFTIASLCIAHVCY